jgi:nicotinate-nucleotide adenylyltransferase
MEKNQSTIRRSRVVIFGGTFNPVHLAHTHVVKEILRLIVPDRLYVVPAAVPPHKQSRGLLSAEHRVAMLELAMHDLPVILSDVELKRGGKSFTVDTVRTLLKEVGDAEIYLTMGGDAFFEFHTWRDDRTILSMAGLIVVTRPGVGHGEDLPRDVMGRYLTDRIDPGYTWDQESESFVHPLLCRVIPLTVALVSPLSSTDVRTCIEQGDRPTALLHPKVLRYIEDKGLYR